MAIRGSREIETVMNKLYLLIVFISSFGVALPQQGMVHGRVYNAKDNQPLEFATVKIEGTNLGAITDMQGDFVISDIRPGFVHLLVSMVGFEPVRSVELQIQGNQTTFVDIALKEATTNLSEVLVRPNLLSKRNESPLSLQTLGVQQIEKSAGANRDVSKLVQTLPGVGATDPNRNDLIVRGGGPAENVFYLDGVEIPIINHFTTQGASGGVVGIINPDFVREISFYTGAFPASRSNALSSVMEIKQRDGASDRLHAKLSVGASDAALTLEGPIGNRSSVIVSARQSYLQWLFRLIRLPFLPTYNDFQIKYKYKLGTRHELSFIGLGAIDDMSLNRALQNSGTEAQRYILSYLPEYRQWNYTIGAVYKYYGKGHYDSWVLSHNMLRNGSIKYRDNDLKGERLSEYQSDELEYKLRYERTYTLLPFRLTFGVGLKHATYINDVYRYALVHGKSSKEAYIADMSLLAYSAFVQASDEYLGNRLKVSLGMGLAGNTLNAAMSNLFCQATPRLSISYALTKGMDLSASLGRYTMLPSYTTIGYRDGNGSYVNKDKLRYITSSQAALGVEYRPGEHLLISAEGFYKSYTHYPISVSEGVSLASKGADYGQVGDEAVLPNGLGRAYGVELLARLLSWRQLSATATYTLFRSEFSDSQGVYRPSSWDTRHMINLLISYHFGQSWYVSARWRYVGGAPYTPIDMDLSTSKEAWRVRYKAYPDYERFNSLRLPAQHQLDLRFDKEFYFRHWLLNLYVDIQNAYLSSRSSAPIYTNLDTSGRVMDDPQSPQDRQRVRVLDYYSRTILPTIGLIVKL